MKRKIKFFIIPFVILGALALYAGTGQAEDGPYAYIRYFENGSDVDAHVYWDDSAENGGPYSFAWANDVVPSGSDLDWNSAIPDGAGTKDACAKLTLSKYKNYYFKIYKGSKTTIVRAFPVDFNNVANPQRYQNDYAHGNFTPDTGMCAACHSTHTALKEYLLKQATYYELCMLCHGNSTTQSKYDVERGKVYTGSGWVDSLAGPMGTGVGSITSKHDVDDTVNTKVYVPGSDQSSPARMLTFTCVSCHNGHGGRNDNYRLLKKTVYPSDDKLWEPQTVNYAAYAIVKDPAVGEEVYFVSGNTEFCTGCHLDYDEGSAHFAGGVYQSVYRHPVTVGGTVYSVEPRGLWPAPGDYLPLQYYSGAGAADKRTAVVCETCHFAHGTYKSFNVYLPDTGEMISSQKMLRLDNYGVCQSCHKK